MAIPTYDKLMLPLLQFAGDNQEHTVQWAKTYLKKAGLLESKDRGKFRITQRGIKVLQDNPRNIDNKFLLQFPEFHNFFNRIKKDADSQFINDVREDQQIPEELIETTYQQLREKLADDLLDYILSSPPAFFERLVVDLLLAMGYGGALENAGQTIGRSGDGGIDGYIQQDKLGLDVIYLQAKRWDRSNIVGRPTVQTFVGSLMGAGATKGVLITTSRFSQEATQYARGVQNLKVILIDGEQLTKLMIEHGVGVSVEKTYVIRKIDENYFPDMP